MTTNSKRKSAIAELKALLRDDEEPSTPALRIVRPMLFGFANLLARQKDLAGPESRLWRVANEYGRELARLCRQVLHRPENQTGCFRNFTEDEKRVCLSLAMDVLALYGK